jgi:phospholipid/cholesterol/gamma-HCH transport system substrate-binding protein
MDRDRRASLVVGVFVVGSIALLAGVILTLSSERGLWKRHYRLVTYFDNVQGLIPGAPIRLAGKDVGTVEHVRFSALEAERLPVQVDLLVEQSVQHRIREDSLATIATIGLLGDKYVEISMGTRAAEVLPAAGEVSSQSPLDLNGVVTRGTAAVDNIATLAANVNEVVESFGEKMGGDGLAESVTAVSEIVREVQEGDGLLHSLIYDSYEGGGVESIERSLVTLEDILQQIAHGDGILHTFIYESDEGLTMEALAGAALARSILEKVDEGEGTIGLLLNDPTLYDDLKSLVGGAQRSLMVRSLIRLSSEEGTDE